MHSKPLARNARVQRSTASCIVTVASLELLAASIVLLLSFSTAPSPQ